MAKTKKTELKHGFTTGAAAAAAVKGALYLLLKKEKKQFVTIGFIGGGHRDIDLFSLEKSGEHTAVCTVIKDAGDDPDVTHKAEIGAVVSIKETEVSVLTLSGGKGVGRVTKPGLEIPPGHPAINSGPRQMITSVVEEMLADSDGSFAVSIEIFVPEGETLAGHTLNARLGIIGGISILGTTGVVRPMSHEAYIATIRSSLSVARACGVKKIFFTTGRRSERFAQKYFTDDPEEAFIQMGDFFKLSLESAARMGFSDIVLAVFFGKALKMADGLPHTHAAKTDLCLKTLSRWTLALTGNEAVAQNIVSANTARQAFFMLEHTAPAVIARVGSEIICSARSFSGISVNIRAIIFDFSGRIYFDSNPSRRKT
jgi:cobalt-precorrin-5B (C1)-methyltransferase